MSQFLAGLKTWTRYGLGFFEYDKYEYVSFKVIQGQNNEITDMNIHIFHTQKPPKPYLVQVLGPLEAETYHDSS